MSWNGTKHFKPNSDIDRWGDWDKLSKDLITELQRLRDHLNRPIFVTSGYRYGDGSSQHHKGLAVDIVCPTYTKDRGVESLLWEALRFDFKGIGVYPNWKYQDIEVGGLHLDFREAPVKAMWMGIKQGSGQKYLPLTVQNLWRYVK